jgi:putative Mn2+ efflux pump MntP
MIFYLYITASFILSAELFLLSSVTSFLKQKFGITILVKLLLVALITTIVLGGALFMGSLIGNFIPELRNWYAASLFFVLGLKQLYDSIKLAKTKRAINPLDKQGLMILTFFSAINSLFVGIGFGMLSLPWMDYFWGILPLFLGAISGYFWGLKTNKLRGKHFEIISSVLYLIIAIILITN